MAGPCKATANMGVQANHTLHIRHPAFACSTGCQWDVLGCSPKQGQQSRHFFPQNKSYVLYTLTALQKWVSASMKCKYWTIPSSSLSSLFLFFSWKEKGIKGSTGLDQKNWEEERNYAPCSAEFRSSCVQDCIWQCSECWVQDLWNHVASFNSECSFHPLSRLAICMEQSGRSQAH